MLPRGPANEQVIDHERYEDARTLLSSAADVYKREEDADRAAKASRISSLVDLVESASTALRERRYVAAEALIDQGIQERASLAAESPLVLQPPACALLAGAEAKAVVMSRVHAAARAERNEALSMLDKEDFDAAEAAAASSAERFAWWAGQRGNPGHAGGDDGQAGDDGVDCEAVVREARELTAEVAVAARNARALSRVEEARSLRGRADFSGCVQALLAAAKLFDRAGLSVRAVATRSEASVTQGEAAVVEAERLFEGGRLEEIEGILRRAEALFRGALDDARELGRGDGGRGPGDDAGVARRHLDGLLAFRRRVAGDLVMRRVPPALDARDYDLAVRLMLEADDHYAGIGGGKWATSVIPDQGVLAGALPEDARAREVAKVVGVRATLDGDRLRVRAAASIQRSKDPVEARELLSMAEACLTWAGVDLVEAGVTSVATDIHVFESRIAGDEMCRGLAQLVRDGNLEEARCLLDKALDSYRQVLFGIPGPAKTMCGDHPCLRLLPARRPCRNRMTTVRVESRLCVSPERQERLERGGRGRESEREREGSPAMANRVPRARSVALCRRSGCAQEASGRRCPRNGCLDMTDHYAPSFEGAPADRL